MEQLYKEDFEVPTSSEKKRMLKMDVSQDFIDEYIKILKSSQKIDKKKSRKGKKGASKRTSPKKVVMPNVFNELSGVKEGVGLFENNEISMIPESPYQEGKSFQNYRRLDFRSDPHVEGVPHHLEPESPEEDTKLPETVKKLTSPQSFAT